MYKKITISVMLFALILSNLSLVAAYSEEDFNTLAQSNRLLQQELAKGIHPDAIICRKYGYFNQIILGQAAADGNIQAVEILLDAGAGINKQESTLLQTPLFQAAYHAQSDMVEYLLKRGANHSERGIAFKGGLQTPLELVESEKAKCDSTRMKEKYQAVEDILERCYSYVLK